MKTRIETDREIVALDRGFMESVTDFRVGWLGRAGVLTETL